MELLVLQIINYETLFGTYPHPRADEPQALTNDLDVVF